MQRQHLAELVGNAGSQAPPLTCCVGDPGPGAGTLCLKGPPGGILRHMQVREPLLDLHLGGDNPGVHTHKSPPSCTCKVTALHATSRLLPSNPSRTPGGSS